MSVCLSVCFSPFDVTMPYSVIIVISVTQITLPGPSDVDTRDFYFYFSAMRIFYFTRKGSIPLECSRRFKIFSICKRKIYNTLSLYLKKGLEEPNFDRWKSGVLEKFIFGNKLTIESICKENPCQMLWQTILRRSTIFDKNSEKLSWQSMLRKYFLLRFSVIIRILNKS